MPLEARSQGTAPDPTTAGARESGRESGLGYMAQAAFWFAVMGTLVKLASARQLPTMQIVFIRGCFTLLFATLVLWRAGSNPFRTRPGLLLVRGLIGSGALVCFYAAVVHMPLAEATVIHQTAPLFTALLAALLLHERLETRVLVSIGTCLVGVLVIARPGALFGGTDTAAFDWHWAIVALLGSLLSSLAYVTVRHLGRTENPLVVVFYFPLVTAPLTAPFAVPIWVWPDATGWLLLLGIGLATQIAQVSMTKGLAREAAGRATAIGYLQVAFATLFGAIVFGVWPDAWSWSGMALILTSLLLSTVPQRR